MADTDSTIHQKSTKRPSYYSIIRGMEVGQSISWPIKAMLSIRAVASQVGAMDDKRFRTFTDRETREIVVTRLA